MVFGDHLRSDFAFNKTLLTIIVGSDSTPEQEITTGLSLPDRLEPAVIVFHCQVVSSRAVVKRHVTAGPIRHQPAEIVGISLLGRIITTRK